MTPYQHTSRAVPISGNRFLIVDESDFESVTAWRWHVHPSWRSNYAVARRNKPISQTIYAHRFIMGARKGQHVDHINGDGLDNRRSNLRFCTPGQNQFNSRKHRLSSTGFKGVRKSGVRFEAYITTDKKVVRFPGFLTAEDAALAYDAAAIRMHGEFAKTNAMLGLLP